mgnify:CR=1 FL=1
MAKDPKRQLLGKIARQKGQYFEQRLDGSFDYYRDRGYAVIEKTPEPMKVIKPEGSGRFLACYFNGNQEVPDDTILHDGKTYQRAEHLRIDYDSIPSHQRDTLAEMALDLTRQVMNDPELRAKCDQFVESAKHRKREK